MKRPRFQETHDSIRLVTNLALEWAVRSALRRDTRTTEVGITVECLDGVVRLLGVVDDVDQAMAVEDIVRSIEGVREVDNQLRSASTAGSRYRREG